MSQENESHFKPSLQATESARRNLLRRQPLRLRQVKSQVSGRFFWEMFASVFPPFLTDLIRGLGGIVKLEEKEHYPAALPSECSFQHNKGIYYEHSSRSLIVHLDANTDWAIKGSKLNRLLRSQMIIKDPEDGSFWLALYNRCTHLGCHLQWRADNSGFACPCHNSLFNVIGEWVSGPALTNLNRFKLYFNGKKLMIDMKKLKRGIPRPDTSSQLLIIRNDSE